MAVGFGQTFRVNIMNWVFGKGAPTTPAGVLWVSLHTADPGVDGQTANEATGTGYAAVAVVAAGWNNPTAAQPSVVTNNGAITFPTAGGDWSSAATFTHFGLWNHATLRTAANFVHRGTITTPQAVLNGNTPSFATTVLQATLDQV